MIDQDVNIVAEEDPNPNNHFNENLARPIARI